MEQEVKGLHRIIKNYRKDDGHEISEQRITGWINQFLEEDRVFILNELIHIFSKMYFSKSRTKRFLKGMIEQLKNKFGYTSNKMFLDNATFLDLQEEGKSQKMFLELLYKLLRDDFKYNIDDLGSNSQKHIIYIDDVLCTGNTFFNNFNTWANGEGKSRLSELQSKEIDITIYYMFIAKKYYSKKRTQLNRSIGGNFSNSISAISAIVFNKEILKPVEENLDKEIKSYKDSVETNSDNYTKEKGYKNYVPDFFRNEINPEEFYSSIDNRKRLEFIFLTKGIEILNNANVSKINIRPLGYSLPSYKDFGFGAMIFTWRNVANNTPLVFWYSGGGFTPLFVNKR